MTTTKYGYWVRILPEHSNDCECPVVIQHKERAVWVEIDRNEWVENSSHVLIAADRGTP